MTRRLSAFIFALLWASVAFAHPEYLWPTRPTLTDAQMRRIDTLVARAREEFPRLDVGDRRRWAVGLAAELAELDHCRRAEQLLEGIIEPSSPVGSLAVPAAGGRDRECADRFITRLASSRGSSGQIDPRNLYVAGALWRRIGERDKGTDAIDQAEALYAAEEARDPDGVWSCHGGNCLSSLWGARLHALRIYHGTRLHWPEMSWQVSLALLHWNAREARRPGPFVGQRVFEELLFHAVNEGYEPLARAAAENTVDRAASYPAMRMALLMRQGRVAEAMALWPEAGRAFHFRFEPAHILENPAAFHPHRNRFREWMSWREAPGPLSVLPAAWIEAGDRGRAREALATAIADLEAHTDEWLSNQIGRIRAAEAQLDSPGDPLTRLASASPADAMARDYGFAELAAGFAAAGREQEARLALSRISSAAIEHRATVQLPCRAAAGGEASALIAVRMAAPSLQPLVAPGVEASQFSGDAYQTFLCLFRRRQADAAVAYAASVRDPEQKLNLLVAMPLNGGVDDNFRLVAAPPDSRLDNELQVRRRFAALALELVRRHGLWDKHAVASMAADFERLGDYAAVDRILRRVGDPEIRIRIHQALLQSYGRNRVRPVSTP